MQKQTDTKQTTTTLLDSIIFDLMNKGDLSAFLEKHDVSIVPTAENINAAAKLESVARSTTEQPTEIQIYCAKLRNIIQKARLTSLGDQYEKGRKLDNVIAVWLEKFAYFRIPAAAVNACYLAASRRRIETGNETGFFPKLDADFIAAQWFAGVKAEFEKKNRNRRLETKRTVFVNCPDCFGNSTGKVLIEGALTNIICRHENFIDLGDE